MLATKDLVTDPDADLQEIEAAYSVDYQRHVT